MSVKPVPSPFASLRQELKKQRQQNAIQPSVPSGGESAGAEPRFAATQPGHAGQTSRALSEEENHQLFLQAMRGVSPMPHQQVPEGLKAPVKKADTVALARRLAAEGETVASAEHISDHQALLKPVSSEAILAYRNATLQNRIFDQLKQGKLRWFQAVDLHGCTVEEAREAVLAIIAAAIAEEQTVIKIVHGKGQLALLKSCVNGWLRQHSQVLAFHSAPENQGGTGSVLVLLRKARTDRPEVPVRPSGRPPGRGTRQ